MRWLAQFVRTAIHVVVPERCVLCEREQEPRGDRIDVCIFCRASCPRTVRHDPLVGEGVTVACRSLFLATAHTLQMVHVMKYRGGTRLTRAAGQWMRDAWPPEWNARECALVPIPLHRRRARERGFNQAEILARGLADAIGGRVERGAVRRTRPTRPQSSVPEEARGGNVRGAFAAARGESLRERHVVLIDDVVTSGATVCEAARACLDAGAASVSAYAFLRAVRRGEP